MNKLMTILSRIRWSSVIGLVLVVAVVALLIYSIPSRGNVKGNIGLNVKADPSTIKIGEKSTIEVEVKNVNAEDEATVYVLAKTRVDDLLFTSTGDTYVSMREILIGPKESRKLTFEVKPEPSALPGKYGVDVSANEKSYAEGAEATVYINVVKG